MQTHAHVQFEPHFAESALIVWMNVKGFLFAKSMLDLKRQREVDRFSDIIVVLVCQYSRVHILVRYCMH